MGEVTGSCLCGVVKVTSNKLDPKTGVCHCSMCRQWAGGPFFAVDCGKELAFSGEENITVFQSSDWAERGFCKQCGSNLFYRLKANQQYFMSLGLFKEAKDMVFSHQVFIEEKPAYYSFAEETAKMTGEELFAQFNH